MVDESDRPIFGHSWLPILGWGIACLIFLAVFAISIISYVIQQVGPRHIFPLQEAAIRDVLTKNATGTKVDIVNVATCFDCDGYAEDFDDLINSIPEWSASGGNALIGPPRGSISAFGVAIGIANPSAPSKAALVLEQAFTEAKIPFGVVMSSPRPSYLKPVADVEIIISARRKRQ